MKRIRDGERLLASTLGHLMRLWEQRDTATSHHHHSFCSSLFHSSSSAQAEQSPGGADTPAGAGHLALEGCCQHQDLQEQEGFPEFRDQRPLCAS